MAESKFSFSVLDVGQGSMQLVEEGNLTNIVVDCNICGAPEFVARYLGRRKVRHVNLLILTGTDQDHSDPDGFEMLINHTNRDIREIWYPDYACDTDSWTQMLALLSDLKKTGTVVRRVQAGDYAVFNGLAVRILSPHPDDSDTSNNASIVAKISGQNASILCPGDCESEERWKNIIKYFGSHLRSHILVAPHHGSMNGCVEEAVSRIAPSYTVISCGEDNPYDHPHDDALAIYAEYTSESVFVTKDVGSILFESDGDSITRVIEDAGQSPDGKKGIARVAGRRVRASFPSEPSSRAIHASLGEAALAARPTGAPPVTRVGFGTKK